MNKIIILIWSLLVGCSGTIITLLLASWFTQMATGHYALTEIRQNPALCLFVDILCTVLAVVIASNFRKQT